MKNRNKADEAVCRRPSSGTVQQSSSAAIRETAVTRPAPAPAAIAEYPPLIDLEDVELLSDSEFMSDLERSEWEIANGKTKKWKGFQAL